MYVCSSPPLGPTETQKQSIKTLQRLLKSFEHLRQPKDKWDLPLSLSFVCRSPFLAGAASPPFCWCNCSPSHLGGAAFLLCACCFLPSSFWVVLSLVALRLLLLSLCAALLQFALFSHLFWRGATFPSLTWAVLCFSLSPFGWSCFPLFLCTVLFAPFPHEGAAFPSPPPLPLPSLLLLSFLPREAVFLLAAAHLSKPKRPRKNMFGPDGKLIPCPVILEVFWVVSVRRVLLSDARRRKVCTGSFCQVAAFARCACACVCAWACLALEVKGTEHFVFTLIHAVARKWRR